MLYVFITFLHVLEGRDELKYMGKWNSYCSPHGFKKTLWNFSFSSYLSNNPEIKFWVGSDWVGPHERPMTRNPTETYFFGSVSLATKSITSLSDLILKFYLSNASEELLVMIIRTNVCKISVSTTPYEHKHGGNNNFAT